MENARTDNLSPSCRSCFFSLLTDRHEEMNEVWKTHVVQQDGASVACLVFIPLYIYCQSSYLLQSIAWNEEHHYIKFRYEKDGSIDFDKNGSECWATNFDDGSTGVPVELREQWLDKRSENWKSINSREFEHSDEEQ